MLEERVIATSSGGVGGNTRDESMWDQNQKPPKVLNLGATNF